jgi:hypothetical protein
VLGMKLRFSDVSASLIHHRLIDSCNVTVHLSSSSSSSGRGQALYNLQPGCCVQM